MQPNRACSLYTAAPLTVQCLYQLTVTVASRPSGTLATMIPIRKITASSQVYSRISERMKKETPRNTATPVMIWMKCSISTAIGVRPPSSPEAKVAMRPITVRSPVLMTTPRAVPENNDSVLARPCTLARLGMHADAQGQGYEPLQQQFSTLFTS